MAGILPRTRWAVSMLYAVVASAEKDAASGAEESRAAKRKDQRPKPDMVAVSRFQMPRAWLQELFGNMDGMLLRTEPLYEVYPDMAIVTDASPKGIGAILCRVDIARNQIEPWVALEIPLKEEDAQWLGVPWGEAASQGALEAWAVLLAIRFWKCAS